MRKFSDQKGIWITKENLYEPNTSSLLEPVYNPHIYEDLCHAFHGIITGKRKCAGESIASDILYLFTASLIKSFNITTGTNEPLPTLEPKEGFTLGYQGFKAVITAR